MCQGRLSPSLLHLLLVLLRPLQLLVNFKRDTRELGKVVDALQLLVGPLHLHVVLLLARCPLIIDYLFGQLCSLLFKHDELLSLVALLHDQGVVLLVQVLICLQFALELYFGLEQLLTQVPHAHLFCGLPLLCLRLDLLL